MHRPWWQTASHAALASLLSISSTLIAQQLPYQNTALSAEQRAADLVQRMTLDEKISQMMNESPAIPRLGVPRYGWWNEGLHGVARSGYATMFPQAIAMAATWDPQLAHTIGATIAIEARAKYNHAIAEDNHAQYYGLTLWSPNINIFRDPRWGRGQETYGEDPFLTGRLGVAFVKGLQGDDPTHFKTIATPKHFAVHSGPESSRHRFNVTPSPHDLEDTYLPAFRATITEAHADSLMCAYNAVDGAPACANKQLLEETLRKQWGFQGFVTSDCGAVDDFYQGHKLYPDAETSSAAAVLAGTDTNCGNTYKALTSALKKNLLPESAIDLSVKRLFTARFQLGTLDGASTSDFSQIPFSENDSPAHRAIALKAANEAMVLLKNQRGTLPLKSNMHTLAVIGPNAASLLALEGNYNAIPSHPVLPVDGITATFPAARVIYAQGAPYADGIELPAPRTLFHTTDGREGLTGEYFSGSAGNNTPAAKRLDAQVDFDWTEATPAPGLDPHDFTVRWTGTITPPKPGTYQFGMKVGRCGDCGPDEKDRLPAEGLSVTVDGKPLDLDRHTPGTDGWDTIMPEFDLSFTDANAHPIVIEYRHINRKTAAGISLRWKAPVAAELDQAIAAAKQADAVIAFVGLDSELEGEEMPVHVEGFAGGDRTSIDLPEVQQRMLEAVAATGKPLVVVLMNGSALAVNSAQAHADAVLEAWYPGEAGGTAIAATLSGENNPGGKLPITFYSSTDQLPAFDNYAMQGRTYRYFTGKPLYGFGYGLSYTSFAFSNLHLASKDVKAGDTLVVDAELRNTGSVAGDEVAELYLTPPTNGVSPRLALTAFERVHLDAGERKHVSFTLSPRQLSQVDAAGKRAVTPGSYTLSLGGGQPGESKSATTQFVIHGSLDLPR